MPIKVKTYVVLADIHYPKYHKPTLNAVLHFLDENEVDGIVFQGDQLDMENISHHTKGRPGLRSKGGYLKDVNGFCKDVLIPVDKRLPKGAERYWIVGNHERFEQDLIDEQPELKQLVDHQRILDLAGRGYKVIPLGHGLKLGKLNIIHGEILSGIGNQAGMYPARKAVELYAGNVLAAHTHAMQMFTKISPVEHTQKWAGYINGILGETNPSYLRNRPTAWSHGFAILEVHPDDNFNLHLIHVHKGKFSYGGKLYGGKD